MFGVKRVILPKDTYGLDEDGWIDIRTRLTVRAAFVAMETNGDQIAATREMLKSYVTGWFIKAGGEELVYSTDNLLDLPLEMLEVVTKEIEAIPLPKSLTAMQSPAVSS